MPDVFVAVKSDFEGVDLEIYETDFDEDADDKIESWKGVPSVKSEPSSPIIDRDNVKGETTQNETRNHYAVKDPVAVENIEVRRFI